MRFILSSNWKDDLIIKHNHWRQIAPDNCINQHHHVYTWPTGKNQSYRSIINQCGIDNLLRHI